MVLELMCIARMEEILMAMEAEIEEEQKMIIRLSENSKVKVESVGAEEDLEGEGVEEEWEGVVVVGVGGVVVQEILKVVGMVILGEVVGVMGEFLGVWQIVADKINIQDKDKILLVQLLGSRLF